MLDSKSKFNFSSTVNITINLIIGIGAVFMVERLVPSFGEIISESSISLASANSMHEAMLINDRALFWQSVAKADSHITLDGEAAILTKIKMYGRSYWSGDTENQDKLISSISEFYILKFNDMNTKEEQARFFGLSGAWALGFLLITSVLLQLAIRSRLTTELIDPMSELISVLRDYSNGNSLRRYHTRNTTGDIEEGGELLNKLLDRDMAKPSLK